MQDITPQGRKTISSNNEIKSDPNTKEVKDTKTKSSSNDAASQLKSKSTENAKSHMTGGEVKPAWYRRFITGFLVIVTILSIALLNLSLWAKHTIISSNGFVGTLAPLADNPKVQTEIASKVTDKVLDSASPQEFAAKLLPTANLASSDESLRQQLKPIVNKSILKAVKNPHFGLAWRDALGTVHKAVIENADANQNSNSVSIDLKPILNDVLDSLKDTSLAFIADEHRSEVLKGDAGKLTVDGSALTKIHNVVSTIERLPTIFAASTFVLFLLAILTSPYRFRTTRKIFLISSILLIVFGSLIVLGKVGITHYAPADAREVASGAIPSILSGLVQQSIAAGSVGILLWLVMYVLHRTKFSRVS